MLESVYWKPKLEKKSICLFQSWKPTLLKTFAKVIWYLQTGFLPFGTRFATSLYYFFKSSPFFSSFFFFFYSVSFSLVSIDNGRNSQWHSNQRNEQTRRQEKLVSVKILEKSLLILFWFNKGSTKRQGRPKKPSNAGSPPQKIKKIQSFAF